MKKLTKREMVLIYIAVLLLLLSGGYYLVKLPSDRIRMVTEAELDILKLQDGGTESSDSVKSALKAEIGEKQKLAGESWEDYLSYRPNSMLLPEITSHITEFGIIPESMEVADVSALEDRDAAGKGYTVYQAVVRVEAFGTTEDLYRFLDWTNDRDWIFVTAYSENQPGRLAADSAAYENGGEDGEETGALSMTLNCLMLDVEEEGRLED